MSENIESEEWEKLIKEDLNKTITKKIRIKKPDYLRRNRKITIYLNKQEKEEIEALTGDYESEQDLIKKLLNKTYNLDLKLSS